jgi:chromosomal replication initiation ATPase DnaA
MSVPRQLALALPHAESFAREDFLIGAPNAAALAVVERWPDWPGRAVILVGPEGAGKSHLAAIWAELSGARRISARALGGTNLMGALATGALVVEDAPARLDERALFHLLNLMREEEGYVLITAREPPASWNVMLPDLMSRLRAIPTVGLSAPDDALLRALLIKLFADRQLAVDENLVGYLATRIERSFAAARDIVERLDREALRLKRPVTRALAAELLSRPGRRLDGPEQGLLL